MFSDKSKLLGVHKCICSPSPWSVTHSWPVSRRGCSTTSARTAGVWRGVAEGGKRCEGEGLAGASESCGASSQVPSNLNILWPVLQALATWAGRRGWWIFYFFSVYRCFCDIYRVCWDEDVKCGLSDTAIRFSMKTSKTILNPKVLSLFPFDEWTSTSDL